MRFVLLFIIFILAFRFAGAQDLLTPGDAVAIALKNNFDILVATNSAEIAKINNTAGNAGMLPEVDVTASENLSVSNVKQNLTGGAENNYNNSRTNTLSGSAQLGWTLFDGGKMFITKNKLNAIESLGELEFKDQVLQTEYDVVVAYFEVVREKQQLISINEAIRKNEGIVNILKTSFGAGLTPKTSLLQAQIDLNVFRENAINQETAIEEAKRILNELLSRDANMPFEVIDSIPFAVMPDKKEFSRKLYESNTSILMLQKQVDIADLGVKEFKSTLLPRLRFNAGYNFTRGEYQNSSVLMNQSIGPQIGGSLSIPIFQAGNATRQIRTAKLQLESAQYNLEGTKLRVNSELQNTITAYENQLRLLEIEKSNTELAGENLDIIIERLRLGQTTTLELHQAQENYVDSQTRLINFEYSLKVAETRLKRLLTGL
jgi:outer membrane protein